MPKTSPALLALAAASLFALAGCATAPASSTSEPTSEAPSVVASTSVYGQIAQEIGGDAVEVTSIIDSSAQDPHGYEASARDQLTVQRADLIIENGGGYDAFIDGLIESSGSTAHVITAAEYSHDWPENEGHTEPSTETPAAEEEHAEEEHAEDGHDHSADGHAHVEGFNEHVWYDPHTVVHVAEAIADELTELVPSAEADIAANLAEFSAQIEALEAQLDAVAATDAGTQVFVTEPVPLYLTGAAGLTNATPEEFSEAVEEGQDVPPATLLDSLDIIASGDVAVVIANAQTGGAETTQIIDAAKAAGIPVLEFTETLPDGSSYIQWMQQNIDDLSAALAE